MAGCSAESTKADIAYRAAAEPELLRVGEVYVRAFPESLRDLRSPHLSPRAVADVAGACLLVEPGCIGVAQARRDDRRVVGYIIASADAGRLRRRMLARGLPLVWMWRWLTGRYGLSFRGGLALAGDQVRGGRTASLPGADCPAAVLSLAVDPEWQGRGVGRRLLAAGLSRLRALDCPCVRLEVRPDNQAARRLYESAGFIRVGRCRDSRGWWEIMLLQLREARPPHA